MINIFSAFLSQLKPSGASLEWMPKEGRCGREPKTIGGAGHQRASIIYWKLW